MTDGDKSVLSPMKLISLMWKGTLSESESELLLVTHQNDNHTPGPNHDMTFFPHSHVQHTFLPSQTVSTPKKLHFPFDKIIPFKAAPFSNRFNHIGIQSMSAKKDKPMQKVYTFTSKHNTCTHYQPLSYPCLYLPSCLYHPSPSLKKYQWQFYIWGTSWQNQQNDLCAQRRLSSACALNTSWGPNVSSCGQRGLWSDWTDAQRSFFLFYCALALLDEPGHEKVSHAICE